MDILVATNNPGKIARVRQLLADREVAVHTPSEVGIPSVEVEEGSDIFENAERKARAYLGKTNLPILGLDSAFVIPSEPNLDPAKVRRNALEGQKEAAMNSEEIGQAMIRYYQKLVLRHGGQLPAYWEDAFALVASDGSVRKESGHRPVILTKDVHLPMNPSLPLRSIYIVEATGKYAVEQSPEEELRELRPYQEALIRLLGLTPSS